MEDNYSNAQGYGIFCGKKCVARKKAEGIAPKRGKKNIAAWNAEQDAGKKSQEDDNTKPSKAPLVIGVVLVLGIIATIVIVKMRKK